MSKSRVPSHAAPPAARRRTLWDTVLMHDIALVRLFMGGRVLFCLPAGMAAGYGIAQLVGLPATVGLLLGALPAFLTCFVVVDEKASRVAARSGALIVPFLLALVGSIALREFRILELVLIVGLLFVQFYSSKFGPWAADFGAGLFAAYLCGLLLPLPLTSFPALAAIFVASLASTIAIRWIVFHPNAYRSLLRSRRAFLSWQNTVLEESAALLEGTGSEKRLKHRRQQAHEAALIADGMLGRPGAGPSGETAERLHGLLFDTEQAVDGLARIADELRDAPAAVRSSVAAAFRVVLREGGRTGDRAARELLRRADASPDVQASPDLRHACHRASLLLSDLAATSDDWAAVRRHLPRDGTGVPFQSPVLLAGGKPLGATPIVNAEIADGGMSGPWSRIRISPALRTAIQAAIAVAIVEPLAYLVDGPRFYWGVIGVMVVLAGTNSTHERLRKVANRGIGTVVGGAVGIGLVSLLGTDHVWWTLIVVVVFLTGGMYGFGRSYALWVVGLVVVLCQVYLFSGSFTDELILYRLAENLLGALVAVGVSAVVLPVATGTMIRRATLRHLAAVRAFIVVSAAADAPGVSAPRLRAASRAVDQATYQLESVLKPLVRFSPGARDRKDDETRTTLVGVGSTIRSIAYRGEREEPLDDAHREALGEIGDRLTNSIDALSHAVSGERDQVWVSSVDLIAALDASLEAESRAGRGDRLLLSYRLHALGRIDDALSGLGELNGMGLAEHARLAPLPDRRGALSAGHVRNRFPTA